MFMLNMVLITIRMVIIDNPIVPKHDPGIMVWWLFCIKFGQRGRYTENHIKLDYKRKIKNLEKMESLLGKDFSDKKSMGSSRIKTISIMSNSTTYTNENNGTGSGFFS